MSGDALDEPSQAERELRDRIATMVEGLRGYWSRLAIAQRIRAGHYSDICLVVKQLKNERDYLRSQVELYREMLGELPNASKGSSSE